MSTKPTKTSSGGMREAKQRLAQAEKYLQIAKAETGKDTASLQVAATNASKDFELLIGKKDEANYGFNISITELKTILRKAEGLVTFAHKSINF